MKKPRFNQLYGTPAHKLRHNVAMALTAGTVFASVIVFLLGNKYRTHEVGHTLKPLMVNPLTLLPKREHETFVPNDHPEIDEL